MRFSKERLFRLLTALLACGALTIAGTALAGEVQEDDDGVIDDNFDIGGGEEDDEVSGSLDVSGNNYGATVRVDCIDGYSIIGTTEHPDSVKLGRGRGDVRQTGRDNEATVMAVHGVDGMLAMNCDKAKLQAGVRERGDDAQGRMSLTASGCLGLTPQQAMDFEAACEEVRGLRARYNDATGEVTRLSIRDRDDAN